MINECAMKMLNTVNWPHVTGPRFSENGTKLADGLLDWAGIYYPGYKPADLQVYFNRGQFVDQACNLLGQGEQLHVDTWKKADHEGWAGFIEAYQKFKHNEQWRLIDCAQYVRNEEERYHGTLDQRGVLWEKASAIIDIKTGSAPEWTGLQLAFYDLALSGGRLKLQRYALELHADATYKLIRYSDFTEYSKCRIVARCYWISREYGGSK